MALFRRILSVLLALAVMAGLAVAPDRAAAQGYVVRSGDVLRIEVLQDESLSRNVLVTPDGSINFPFAGSLRASGRTPDQIAALISQGIAPNFATPPNVFVSVAQIRPADPILPQAPVQPEEDPVVQVYILGEVNAPGPKEMPVGATLLQALSTSGGFTNFAATKRVQLRRTDPATGAQRVVSINYRALAQGAGLSRDIVLTEGDVILVPQRRLFE